MDKLVNSLIEGAVSYGPFVTLLLIVAIDRYLECRRLQREKDALTRDVLNGLNNVKVAADAGNDNSTAILAILREIRDRVLLGVLPHG